MHGLVWPGLVTNIHGEAQLELRYYVLTCTSPLIPAVRVFLVKHDRNVAEWVEHLLHQCRVRSNENKKKCLKTKKGKTISICSAASSSTQTSEVTGLVD